MTSPQTETLIPENFPGNTGRKPEWLKVKLPYGYGYKSVYQTVEENKLHTICQSGLCPNMGECWGAGTATFMILGNICTRSCSFCAVETGRPGEVDYDEPARVAEAIQKMKLKHCVITSVNRDELPDSGMRIWASTVREVKKINPEITIETLIPDVNDHWDALDLIINEKPDVISHNMETVKRLYRTIRPQAKYERSLELLNRLKKAGIRTKSGIMLGLGETVQEVCELMDDLANVKLDVFTMGQYLQPSKLHHEVVEYIHPQLFEYLKETGISKGFDYVESGPLVRSSYHSEKHIGKSLPPLHFFGEGLG
ncbi:MAG: lipoyl synthase [Bacteroidetes bacterium RIFCSPLOWO2_12_FULL_37_12]|nr:MAG: lipoyl synthase [Bacteroidetes bacterium RIFCSPLOWO2_12_FULL_37_12]